MLWADLIDFFIILPPWNGHTPKQVHFMLVGSGFGGVGKTCLFHRIVDDDFDWDNCITGPTVGYDWKSKQMIKDGHTVKVTILDTAGQNVARVHHAPYMETLGPRAIAMFFVYSVDKKESFENIDYWLDLYDKSIATRGTYVKAIEPVKILVANSCDIPEANRQVSPHEGEAYAKNHNMVYFDFTN